MEEITPNNLDEEVIFIPRIDEDQIDSVGALSETQNYSMAMSQIPEAHRHTKGKGIVVAVIDTGGPDHFDLLGNLLPAYNTSTTPPALDLHGHGCIAPSDLIWTDRDGIVAIKEFYENSTNPDAVLLDSKEGTEVREIISQDISTIASGNVLARINAVHRLPYIGEVFRVKTREGELTLTPWHPVYVVTSSRGSDKTIVRCRADELKIGDRLLLGSLPVDYQEQQFPSLPLREEYVCTYCGYVASRGARKQCRSCNKYKWHSGPRTVSIPLTTDLAFWIGLVTSDGHVMRDSRSIEFCGCDRQLVEEFVRLSMKLFGREAKWYSCGDRNLYRVRLHANDVHRFVEEVFGLTPGAKSLTVKFPKILETTSREVIGAFIAGLIEGDGNIDSQWKIRVCTGSEQFAQGLKNAIRLMGGYASVREIVNQGFQSKIGSNLYYHVQISPLPEITQHLIIKRGEGNPKPKTRSAASVVSIARDWYVGEMYDLTVEGSHNYVANGVVVSNTHVAGIIAALDNGVGVIGVAPEAKILPIKALADHGGTGWKSIEDALRYATAMKADIINMSLGSRVQPPASLYEAIKAAHDQGILIVVAAGNDGADTLCWPAAYDEVIAVAAVDENGQLARFSNRDERVDAAAPGVQIYSTHLNQSYAYLDGTSQAAPFISGVCALVLSYLRQHPTLPQVTCAKDMIAVLDRLTGDDHRLTVKGHHFGVPEFCNARWLDGEGNATADAATLALPVDSQKTGDSSSVKTDGSAG